MPSTLITAKNLSDAKRKARMFDLVNVTNVKLVRVERVYKVTFKKKR